MADKTKNQFAENLCAFLHPFASLLRIKKSKISDKNMIVDAYIYNWDDLISKDNKITSAQLDFDNDDKIKESW